MQQFTLRGQLLMACAVSLCFGGAALAQSNAESEAPPELDAAYAADGLLPPEAKPGECYARVYIPAVEKQVARQVLVKEATEELRVIEAQYETVVEKVEVAKEAEKLELVPAVFKTETTTIQVEPEKEVEEVIPAEYEEVVERVKIREAYRTWKKGEGPIQRYDEATGEIMCLVEIPAEYNEVTKRIIKNPPRTITKVIPAVMKTMEVKVMVEPPKTRTVAIPAKFEEVEVRKLVTPAKVDRIEIPARYETVYETVKASAGRMEWRPILCSTNVSEDIISRLQIALRDKGFNVGVIDGVLGAGTMNAVKRYQRENGLAEGQITIETLESLNVAIR